MTLLENIKLPVARLSQVFMLMQTMEEFANWGFHFIEDKLTDDPNYFYRETAFLEIFLAFEASVSDSLDDEEPEPLD